MTKHLKLNTGRKIGFGYPSYLIAEIGSNHDGSLKKALKLITLAKEAGADAVKFQSFQAATLTNFLTKKKSKWVKEPAFEILQQLTVPDDWHYKLFEHSKSQGIDFISTPFDLERLALLGKLNIPLIKIASGDLTNFELLKHAAKLKKPIVISTGAAYLKEIEKAVDVLKQAGGKEIAILQCVSCYPSDFKDTNLLAMQTLKTKFKVPVGYSDHTPGITVPIAAVALGASIIEKHFTDNPKLKGPDHPHSLSPKDFAFMVKSIRELEQAFGDGIKRPVESEKHERIMARRALYAKKEISLGTILTRDLIKTVRHAFEDGILVEELENVIGCQTKEAIKEHTLLTWTNLKKKKV